MARIRYNSRGTAWHAAGLLIGLIIAFAGRDAGATSGVIVETVSDYTWWPGCYDHSCDTLCDADGNGLWNALTAGGTGYSGLVHYIDSSVWDTDFYDPDLTGYSPDADTWNFDKAGAAISFGCAHGACNDAVDQNCTTSANCGRGKYCPGMPPLNPGESKVCVREKQRQFITSSWSYATHGNVVWYGQTDGGPMVKSFALGEDSASGAFGGAGTNGGSNTAVIINSCGLRSAFYVNTTYNFFSGVHQLMMQVPTAVYRNSSGFIQYSDTANSTGRGVYVANAALTNPFSAVSDAWLNATMASYYVDETNHAYGANIVIARDATQSNALWHVTTESWVGAKSESNDPTGKGFWNAKIYCNYDCATYGW